MSNWFFQKNPQICGLCDNKIKKKDKFAKLRYKVGNKKDIQEMDICQSCVLILEASKYEPKKSI